MFDNLQCRYPLPIEGANELKYQTKDTPAQQYADYEIREDGTLWQAHESRDSRGFLARLLRKPARMTKRWEPAPVTGEVRFYSWGPGGRGWVEFAGLFMGGKLNSLRVIEHTRPGPTR